MRFDTYIPCDALKPYVRLIAISESQVAATYTVLSGTELVIGFQYKGQLSQLIDGKATPLSSSGITGLHDRYKLFENTPNIGTVLVYFREAAASAFFSQPLHELFGESLSLDNFMLHSELLLLEEQLYEAKTDSKRIRTIENFLLKRLRDTPSDSMVKSALALIHKSKGNIRIKDLAVQLHTSASPLEKRFRQAVGTSPKKFDSIIRFRHILQQFSADRSFTQLGYEAGYYDQAHFIKEFKLFTGQTPELFFGSKK